MQKTVVGSWLSGHVVHHGRTASLSFIGNYDVIYVYVVCIMHYDVINLGIA